MTETTKIFLEAEKIRDWTMVWSGIPGLTCREYKISGTAQEVFDDFRRRFSVLRVRGFKLVEDDGDLTIRIVFADESIATVFVS
jgi:hypothetical protein